MRKLGTLILLPLIIATACSKDDKDENENPNDPANTPSSFTLKSADNSIDLSGTATWSQFAGMDTTMSIVLIQEEPEIECLIVLTSVNGIWATDSYTGDIDAESQPYFGLLINSAADNYISIDGNLNITDKEIKKNISGEVEASLWDPATTDTIEVTGSFHAKSVL